MLEPKHSSRRVTVIFNPNAGAGRFKLDEGSLLKKMTALSRRSKVDLDIQAIRTTCKGDCYEMAKDAISDGCDVIAVAGGDGTIMEAVNSIAGTGASLGIIPVGSGNDTIVSIAGHKDISRCLQDIIGSRPEPLDLASMNGTYFLNVLGIGLDAEVNHMVAKRRDLVTRIGPALTYTFAAVKVLLNFKPHLITISVDGSPPLDHSISLCTIGNGTTCGGGYRLTPRAVMNDGQLDLSISDFIGKIPSLLNIRKAYIGKHILRAENTYRHFKKVEISGNSMIIPYHMDGEPGTVTKMIIDVVPGGISCVHPHIPPHLT